MVYIEKAFPIWNKGLTGLFLNYFPPSLYNYGRTTQLCHSELDSESVPSGQDSSSYLLFDLLFVSKPLTP